MTDFRTGEALYSPGMKYTAAIHDSYHVSPCVLRGIYQGQTPKGEIIVKVGENLIDIWGIHDIYKNPDDCLKAIEKAKNRN